MVGLIGNNKKPTKQYATWEEATEENDGFFCFYDSIEDAAANAVQPAEIFEATMKSIGFYESKTIAKKVKKK